MKKNGLLNPKGLTVGGNTEKILFSNGSPWSAVEDDHKPFMAARKGLHLLKFFVTPGHILYTVLLHVICLKFVEVNMNEEKQEL